MADPDQLSVKIESGHARPVGNVEAFLLIEARQKIYANFAIYGKLRSFATELQFCHALRSMFLKYPILGSSVVPEHTGDLESYYSSEEYLNKPGRDNDYICVLDQLKLDDVILNKQPEHVEFYHKILNQWTKDGYEISADFTTAIEGYTFKCWEKTKPQFRIVLLPSADDKTGSRGYQHFVYITNHVCSDGTSGCNFVQDISVELGNLGSNLEPLKYLLNYEVDGTQLPKLPEPVEQQVSYKSDFPFFVKVLISELGKKLVCKKWKPTTVLLDQAIAEHDSHLIKVDVDSMQNMRQKVKDKLHGKATLTPFLQACWFVSCYQAGIFDDRKWGELLANMCIPVNARAFLESKDLKEQYRYGSCVGGTNYNYSISSFNVKTESEFWDLVSYYDKVFTKDREQKLGLKNFGVVFSDTLLKHSSMDKIIVDDMGCKERFFSLFSNIGFFPQKSQEQNPFQLQEMLFFQTASEMPFVFSLSLVSTDVNGMSLMVSCTKGSIPTEKWHKVLQTFRQNLASFGDAQTTDPSESK